MTSVNGSKVLIVEDEYCLAAELEQYFASLGACVLGPVPTIEDAYPYVAYADAAILDVCLNGKHVFPLADDLAAQCVPFVFYTGHDGIVIPDRFRYVGCLAKPAECRALAQALFQIRPQPSPAASSPDAVLRALPRLRLVARLHLGDTKAADRLVEITLEKAMDDVRSKPDGLSVDTWLGLLMQDVYQRQGSRLLN